MSYPPRSGRRNFGRAQNADRLDPYAEQHKLREPTVCRECRAVYHRGRWQWGDQPDGADSVLCSACRRIQEALPAGEVILAGDFVKRHRAELTGLIHNQEAAEKGEHPLNRVIRIEDTDDGVVVYTTDIHLPRRLGTALKHAYDGALELNFDDAAYYVRVRWTAPA